MTRWVLPCPSCGFMYCSDREQCYKDARFDIDRSIRGGYGSLNPGYQENGLGYLCDVATAMLYQYSVEE